MNCKPCPRNGPGSGGGEGEPASLIRQIHRPVALETLPGTHGSDRRVALVIFAPRFIAAEVQGNGRLIPIVQRERFQQRLGVRLRDFCVGELAPIRDASSAPPARAAPRSEFIDCTVPEDIP